MSNRMYYSEDARMQAQQEKSVLILLAFSVGAVIGSLVMLIFVSESDANLTKMTDERIRRIEHQIQNLRNKAEERFADLT